MQRWAVPKQGRKWEAVIDERDRCIDILKDIEYYQKNVHTLSALKDWQVKLVVLSSWETTSD